MANLLGVRWQKCFEDGEETKIWHVVANIFGGGTETFFQHSGVENKFGV